MKKNKTALILSTIVCLLPIILAVIVYKKLPDKVPIHFNFSGEPDTYAPKAVAVFGFPVLLAVGNLIQNFMVSKDPKTNNVSLAMKTLTKWLVPISSIIFVPMTILFALGVNIPLNRIVPVIIGVIIIVTGNYLPKCKQNYTIGIKIPWTLNSEANWNKTHRFAGFIWVIGGLMIMANVFISFIWLMILIIIILTIAPLVYSYLLFKKGV